MDLVARKLSDGGAAVFALLDEVLDGAESARAAHPTLADAVWNAAYSLREATEWLLSRPDLNDRFAGAVPYLRAFARVLGGQAHLAAALSGDAARLRLATFYIRRLLPEHAGLLAHVREGAADLMAFDPAELAA